MFPSYAHVKIGAFLFTAIRWRLKAPASVLFVDDAAMDSEDSWAREGKGYCDFEGRP